MTVSNNIKMTVSEERKFKKKFFFIDDRNGKCELTRISYTLAL